jgi:hypothetical protein
LHFKKEKEPRRREIATAICRLPVEVHVYSRSCKRNEERARQDCVGRLARDLLDRGAHRLVIDSRSHRDIEDERTIYRALGPQGSEANFAHEHLDSTSEPLLWVADSVAWCFNAGGRWRQRVDTIVSTVIDLDNPM